MTFEEATQLGLRIRQHYSRLDVVAIGRFLPLEELDTTPERWGLTLRIDGRECKRVWSADEIVYYADADPPKRPATKSAKPVEQTGEPLLF